MLHRLDPRTKLLSLVALMVAALASRDVAPVALFTVFVALVALVGRLPPVSYTHLTLPTKRIV